MSVWVCELILCIMSIKESERENRVSIFDLYILISHVCGLKLDFKLPFVMGSSNGVYC